MKKLILALVALMVVSCAKLPIESVTLANAVVTEGKRMHDLNMSLIDQMFREKREKIDLYIKNEYTPLYLTEFQKRIPAGTDLQKEFPSILQYIIPEINSRRDSLQLALETQRIRIVTKLNQDYSIFSEAATSLTTLVASGVKVNEERAKLYDRIKSVSDNKLDINKINTKLDEFVQVSGNVGAKISSLNSAVGEIIK